jgi:hypothetical protein
LNQEPGCRVAGFFAVADANLVAVVVEAVANPWVALTSSPARLSALPLLGTSSSKRSFSLSKFFVMVIALRMFFAFRCVHNCSELHNYQVYFTEIVHK